jgi:hypothetical protein
VLSGVVVSGDLLGTAEAAGLLGWSRAKVKREAQAGRLPHALKMPGETGAYLFDRVTILAVVRAESLGRAS